MAKKKEKSKRSSANSRLGGDRNGTTDLTTRSQLYGPAAVTMSVNPVIKPMRNNLTAGLRNRLTNIEDQARGKNSRTGTLKGRSGLTRSADPQTNRTIKPSSHAALASSDDKTREDKKRCKDRPDASIKRKAGSPKRDFIPWCKK